MAVDGANTTSEAQLTLRSQIAELARVPLWVETLATEFKIPAKTQFAMDLCLEEVLSNIIRHGYAGKQDRPIVVRYVTLQNSSCLLMVDDEAPPFNPLSAEDTPVQETLDGARIGGLGIRLLREFATALEYQRTPTGNRLTMSFGAAD